MQTKWRSLLVLWCISTLGGVYAQRSLAQAPGITSALTGEWLKVEPFGSGTTWDHYDFLSDGTYTYKGGKDERTVVVNKGVWEFIDGQLHMKIQLIMPESSSIKPGYEYFLAISMPNKETLILANKTYKRVK